MSYFKRPFGAVFLLIMILMALKVTTKKPICINSKVVNKIDRLSPDGTLETIYNCSQYKQVIYSEFFFKNIDFLQAQIGALDLKLYEAGLQKSFDLKLEDRTDQGLMMQASELSMGLNFFKSTSFVEKTMSALVTYQWFKTNTDYANLYSDFIYNTNITGDEKTLMSIAFKEAFASLSLFDQFKFRINFVSKYKKEISLAKSINEFTDLFKNNNAFYISLITQFNSAGYYLASQMANKQFDIIIQTNSVKDLDMASLAKISLDNKEKSLAVKTAEGFFVLPSMAKYSLSEVGSKFAQIRLVFGKAEEPIKYMTNTNKLIWAQDDNLKKNIIWQKLIEFKSEDFFRQNSNLNFVQYHMPSYRLFLIKNNVFSGDLKTERISQLLRMHNVQQLGIQSATWSEKSKAYKVAAYIDYIQYYRIN